MKLGLRRRLLPLIRPLGRRVAVLLVVSVLWIAWAVIPASPAVSWSCSAGQNDYFQLVPDGRTILHTIQTSHELFISWSIPTPPVRVCDAVTGRERFAVDFPSDADAHMTGVSPDGSWFVVEGKGGHDACLQDMTDGHELARFPGDDRSGWWIHISPDGRELALTPPRKAEIHLWDVAKQKVRVILPGAIRVAAYSPNGNRLATIGWDDRLNWPGPENRPAVTVWDVATGRDVGRRDLPLPASIDFKFSPDGRWLAAIYEKRAGRRAQAYVDFSAFAPETSVPGTVTLWDLTTGTEMTLVEFSDCSQFEGIAFTEDSRLFFVRARTGPLFWDLQSSPQARRISTAHVPSIGYYPILIPNTGRMVLHGDDPAELELWTTADMTRRTTCRLRIPEKTPQMSTSPDGSTLAVLLGGNSPIYSRVAEFFNKHVGIPKNLERGSVIQEFDTQTGAERAEFVQDGDGRLLGFSPDGATLWTSAFVADSADGKRGVAVIRGWRKLSHWPPTWLLVVTTVGLLLLIIDWRRGRRHASAPKGRYNLAQGASPGSTT